jgi:hypothetical protein
MFARPIAVLLVLVLVGPSVVAATCELMCANHHDGTPSSSAASCHEHQGSMLGLAISATASSLCHESGDLPSAIVDAWIHAVLVTVAPAATTVVVTAPIITRMNARAHDRSAPFPPRPALRPLRV